MQPNAFSAYCVVCVRHMVIAQGLRIIIILVRPDVRRKLMTKHTLTQRGQSYQSRNNQRIANTVGCGYLWGRFVRNNRSRVAGGMA